MKSRHNIKEFFYSPTNIGRNTLFSSLTFTGKEKDEETGYSYHGARYYDPETSGLWLSVDPMSDKYPGISPYAYCAWNPMRLIDSDGRKIRLPSMIEYSYGMTSTDLSDADKAIIAALNRIGESTEGLLMINKLMKYDGTISIDLTDDETNIIALGPQNAFYNEDEKKPGTGIGFEIEINWNYENPEKIPTLEGIIADATYNLLDEICHAYDFCTGYGNASDKGDGISKLEYQGVYRSNVVRNQLNDHNYRSAYSVNYNETKGTGQITASKKRTGNVFYRPSWYPRCTSDNDSYLLNGF